MIKLQSQASETNSQPRLPAPAPINNGALLAGWLLLALLGLGLLSSFWVTVPVGERGVWMRFGQVQETLFAEGVHFVVPLVDTVQTLSIRVQKQDIETVASSQDLQDVTAELSLNWHIQPEQAHFVFQQVGTEPDIIDQIITPTVAEAIKAGLARYTAEAIITQRDRVKAEIDTALAQRLQPYHLVVDEIALTNIQFSQQFRDAVEAKQIAEQETKRSQFVAQKAIHQAETEINLAQGQARANQILENTLTSSILKYQALQKWDGKLPIITDSKQSTVVEIEDLLEAKD